MQQFTVPQFIDVEDKIIGPITVRQFIVILVGGLFIFLEYKLFGMIMFILVAIPTFAVFITFAFVKINGMPFHYFLLNIIQTFKRPNLLVWSREIQIFKSTKLTKIIKTATASPTKRPLTSSRISDLSLVLDTGGIYKGEESAIRPFSQLEVNK